MGSPSFPVGGLGVGEDACAGGRNGSSVEIEVAINLGPGGKFGVDVGASEQVQGEEALGQEPVPEVERKSGRKTAEPGNEVVLEGADGSFCCILVVNARWDQLVVNSDVSHVLF
jgi:hypothetical protein